MTTMVNRAEAAKGTAPADKAPAAHGAHGAHAADKNGASAAAAPAASGGIKALLPLIANVVLMPVLAYAMTAYVLVPKLAKKPGSSASSQSAQSESHGSAAESKGESTHGAAPGDMGNGRTKISVPLSKKILVNVSGTMG